MGTAVTNATRRRQHAGRAQKASLRTSKRDLKDNGNLLHEELQRLAEAIQEGRMNERGQTSLFGGEHLEVVQGINEMLDTLTVPLHVAIDFMEKIGRGVVPAKITETYHGDFNALKEVLNTCVDELC